MKTVVEQDLTKFGSAAIVSQAKNRHVDVLGCIFPVLLVFIATVSRSGALQVGFLADDLDCMQYIHRIFNGEPLVFFQRMVSPWQDPHVQLMYRPLADVSLCLDYLVWKTNAVGYHLTNLLFHSITVLSLYFLSARVFTAVEAAKLNTLRDRAGGALPFSTLGAPTSNVAAFLTALLFCVNPLWTEPVVWIVGRMDVMCGAFTLTALVLYLKAMDDFSSRSGKLWFTASVGVYALALLSKEVAILFPAVLIFTGLCFSGGSFATHPKKFIRTTALLLAPFVALDAVFLLLRTAVLGTFPGGYIGTYGQGLTETILSRLFHRTTLERIVVPLHEDLFPVHSIQAALLKSVYCISAAVIALRIPFLPWNGATMRVICWSLGCVAITFIPCLQVYAVNGSLSGARVLYLPGAFACMAVMACLYPLFEKQITKSAGVFRAASVVVVLAMCLLFGGISYRMVDPWINATNIMNSLRREIQRVTASLPPQQKLVVLNLPGEDQGAYELFRFLELQVLTGPAFCEPSCADKLASADIYPVLAPTSCGRLQRLMADPKYLVAWFDPAAGTLVPITKGRMRDTAGDSGAVEPGSAGFRPALSATSMRRSLDKGVLEAGKMPALRALALPVRAVDLASASVTVRRLDSPQQEEEEAQYLLVMRRTQDLFSGAVLKLGLSLSGPKNASGYLTRFDVDSHEVSSKSSGKGVCSSVFADGLHRCIYLPLADIPERLPVADQSSQFRVLLKLPGSGYTHKIDDVRIIGPELIPAINANRRSMVEMPDGLCRFISGHGGVDIDASTIPGAHSVMLEVSGRGMMFNASRVQSDRGQRMREAAQTHVVDRLSFTWPLTESDFARGRYQIRACALDKTGALIGVFSDPLTFVAHCEN